MQDDSIPKPDPFARKPKMRTTVGEILPDRSVLDLVVVNDRLLLCHSDGLQHLVLPHFEFGNIAYFPPRLEPSLYGALKFPGPPVEYGSLTELFNQAVAIVEERGFSSDIGRYSGLLSLASWVPELFFDPPTLIISGEEMKQAAVLFSLLNCMCRRPFLTAQLSRSLPFEVQPTLLVLAPDTSAKACAFWRAANIRSVRVPSRRGTVDSLACTRVFFVSDDEALASWGAEALRLPLLPCTQLLPATEDELAGIANQLQPRFLMFRLRQLAQINRTAPPKTQTQFANHEISRQLLALVQGEPKIVASITPVLEAQQREFREYQQRDPYRAILESVWSPSHECKEISVAEVTKRVNDILRSRGETSISDSRVIGWKLRKLGLPRGRNGDGKHLRFSRQIRLQIHGLASKFQVKLRTFEDCPDCKKG
jgi:hypothetical protein